MKATARNDRAPGWIGAAALLILIAGTALVVGCSNVASPEEDGPSYPLRTAPANVIAKLVESYEAMDKDAFIDVLADTFEFWLNPNDVNDPGNQLPDHWDLATESELARNMLGQGTNVDSIQLALTQIGDPVEIPTPGGGVSSWRCVYAVDLRVFLPNDIILWATGPSRFLMSVDPNATGPSGEMLWEIAKWEDIDPWTRSGEVTWGGIKALYR